MLRKENNQIIQCLMSLVDSACPYVVLIPSSAWYTFSFPFQLCYARFSPMVQIQVDTHTADYTYWSIDMLRTNLMQQTEQKGFFVSDGTKREHLKSAFEQSNKTKQKQSN